MEMPFDATISSNPREVIESLSMRRWTAAVGCLTAGGATHAIWCAYLRRCFFIPGRSADRLRRHHERSEAGGRLAGLCPVEGALEPGSCRVGRLIDPAANGRCAWRDREVWMQSEPRRPQANGDTPLAISVFGGVSPHVGGLVDGKWSGGAAIPSGGPALTCT
jgi:hypothetical protein